MKDVIHQAAEHPTIAKMITSLTMALGGATVMDIIPWVAGLLATSAGFAASVMVYRAQKAVRLTQESIKIKADLEIEALRRAESERLERAKNSPGRRQDDP
jgi:hypothetical protein